MMRFLLILSLAVFVSGAALAQSTPPPQQPTPQQPGPQNDVIGTLFSEAEKSIIRQVLGAAAAKATGAENTSTVGETVQTVIRETVNNTVNQTTGQTTGQNSSASRDDDDDDDDKEARDDDDDKGGKKAGRGKHKNKQGKGKGRGRGKGLPPGLAKRDKLPPGLQKQLERNGKLPPGLQKSEFPEDLQAKLGPPKEGTERAIVGNDAVLIDTATNVVLDVIRNVVNKGGQSGQ